MEEANARLDSLRELLPQLRVWVARLGKLHEEIQRLASFWGKELEASDNPDRSLGKKLQEEWSGLTDRVEGVLRGLHDEGIEIKDLENGLVDFFTLRDGEVVFLCWQKGEPLVGHWHTLDGGFRSRERIEPAGATKFLARPLRGGS